jgi:hypothetical protein
MFNLPRLKLYRTFLILAVMLVSLFVLSSTRRVAAEEPCCEACNAAAASCLDYCWNSEEIKDWMRSGCAAECEPARVACRHACTPIGAPEVCNES